MANLSPKEMGGNAYLGEATVSTPQKGKQKLAARVWYSAERRSKELVESAKSRRRIAGKGNHPIDYLTRCETIQMNTDSEDVMEELPAAGVEGDDANL